MRSPTLTWSDSTTLAAIAVAGGLAAFVGMPVLGVFEHDVFFSLANAYRLTEGQIPHRDFASAWGPLFFLIQAGGLLLSGMEPRGLAYANALVGLATALWMHLTVRARLDGRHVCVMAVYTVLLVAAPFPLGFNPLVFSFAMAYNRYGYALLGIILMECGLQAVQRGSGERPGTSHAVSIGAAWALLVFLKVTYALVAVPFLLMWLWCGGERRRRLLALFCGFGAVALLLLSYLRFDFADMRHDLADAASGRGLTWRAWSILSPAFLIECVPLLLFAAVVTARMGEDAARRGGMHRVRLWLFVLLTVGVGGFLLSTNHQAMSLPLDGFAAIILLDRFGERRAKLDEDQPSRPLVLLLAALCILPLTAMNAVSLVAASWEGLHGKAAPAVRVQCDRGASLIFGPVESSMTSDSGGPAYAQVLNDGLDLIRRRTQPGAGVSTIDMFNPFNYLLGRPSPRGGMAAAAYNYAFSDTSHPSGERFFGNSQYVLVRKYNRSAQDFPIEDYHIEGLLRTYRPVLERDFVRVEETPHWILWSRRQILDSGH